jgi:hypothetical protein
MHQAFKDLLHQYKVDVFRFEHNKKDAEQVAAECMAISEEVLKQKYHYHFHTLPDADRAEIINMINNYTREAVLPPVVEKLVHRQLMLERHITALDSFMEKMLDVLSQGPRTPANVT